MTHNLATGRPDPAVRYVRAGEVDDRALRRMDRLMRDALAASGGRFRDARLVLKPRGGPHR